MRMSNGEINRLGERLRASSVVAPDDLDSLQELRREYQTALHVAQARIAEELGAAGVMTSRLKTVQTLVGKLHREPSMNLVQVQDIAGLRIVGEMTLREQTELAAKIASLFEGSKIIDRRAKPSFGYRAVHVVVKVDSRPVEVQVRTALQDRWAQIVERMADPWGRQIRYGQPPDAPHERVGPADREFVVGLVRRLSPIIETSELSASARQLKVHGDGFSREVVQVLAQIAHLAALSSAS